MVDLVGTCPKEFWLDWIAEGDAAGDPPTGEEWGWYTRDHWALQIFPGDRFYVVAWGRLRGYAPVTRVKNDGHGAYVICRRGGGTAITIPDDIPGFRGLRKRWWHRDCEIPFPDWKTEGFGAKPIKRKSNDDGTQASADHNSILNQNPKVSSALDTDRGAGTLFAETGE